jgi:ribosomal-protein-alanine N-acetyltransferase
MRYEDSLNELLTDPQVSRYISSPPPSPSAFEGFILWAHRQRAQGRCLCFAIVPRGLTQAIGLIQIRALDSTFTMAEWGFALGAPFWSTGLFQEAAGLAVEFAFRTMGVMRLEARAVDENARGNGALQKLGAKGEAVLRRAFNREYSQFLWALVADEWTAPKPPARSPFDAAQLRRHIEKAVSETQQRFVGRPSNPAHPVPFFLTDPPVDPSDEN